MENGTWALLGACVGAITTGFFNLILQHRQLSHNKEMFLLSNRSSVTVKEILSEMLNHRAYIERSFKALRGPIGGYTDDQIRQFLHELEAKKTLREDGEEWWYLIARSDERKAKKLEKISNERIQN